MNFLDFSDRVIVITGAGKGLGRAHALALGERGAKLVINNRRHIKDGDYSSADETVALLKAMGAEAVADYHDLSDVNAPNALASAAINNFGRVDGLLLNAAVNDAAVFHKSDMTHFQKVMDINFFANVALLQQFVSQFRKQRYGRVLFTISSAGLYGMPQTSAYAASKGALHALMLSIAAENSRHNICCNALAPFAQSQMTDAFLDEKSKTLLSAKGTAAMAVYLLSESCDRNGETWVAAGNLYRKACVVENTNFSFARPCESAEQIAEQMAAVNTSKHVENFSDANQSFQNILSQIKSTEVNDG